MKDDIKMLEQLEKSINILNYLIKHYKNKITREEQPIQDEWSNIKFAQVSINIKDRFMGFTGGKIYKIDSIEDNNIIVSFNDYGNEGITKIPKIWCTPSTEKEYVRQFIDKAKLLYGDLRDGDTFAAYWNKEKSARLHLPNNKMSDGYFRYKYDTDEFFIHGFKLYEKGYWAIILPRQPKVKFRESGNVGSGIVFKFDHINLCLPERNRIGKILEDTIKNYILDKNRKNHGESGNDL